MTTLAAMQPGYLPWLGFFDQIQRSDVFVLCGDIAFDKHGWRNRNRVKSSRGPTWLSVPVLNSGRLGQPMNEVQIRPVSWAKKQLRTIAHLYNRAPNVSTYLPELEELLSHPWRHLVDLDVTLTYRMCDWLGVRRPVFLSHSMGVVGDPNQRIINLCHHYGADVFLSGDAAIAYLDVARLRDEGIRVVWQRYAHPVYPQQHGAFVSHLSALDLLLNVGPDSARVLSTGTMSAMPLRPGALHASAG